VKSVSRRNDAQAVHADLPPPTPRHGTPESAEGVHREAVRPTSRHHLALRLLILAATSLLALLATGALGILFATASNAATTSENPGLTPLPANDQNIEPRGTFYRAHGVPKGAEVVYYGIEPEQAYDVSPNTDSWSLNFYMWFRWKGPRDPSTTTAFDNATNAATHYVVKYSYTNAKGVETPIRLKDGYEYQLLYIQAGFSNNFDLSRYPLDTQDLSIQFENTTYDFDQMTYLPDPGRSFDKEFAVPDWNTKNIAYASYVKHYHTDFGDSDSGAGYTNWSLGTYSITISRPISHFVAKLLLPLLVVMIVALMTLLLKARHEISRIALSGTALLALFFLQQGYSADLPPTAPLVLMDEFYVLSYVVVTLVFIRIVWETQQVYHHRRNSDQLMRQNRYIFVTLGLAYSVGIVLLFF